jgi:hypothetical protein
MSKLSELWHRWRGESHRAKRAFKENDVLRAESAAIKNARELRDRDKAMIGLALSGGGIRSATFNLGVLQALAELKLLKRFDYLSTVSGGGYIGSWLSALVHRQSVNAPATASPAQKIEAAESLLAQSTQHDVDAVKFLRSYSNYLTPKLGALSLDTWTAVATYIRNLLLNLTILIGLAVALILFFHAHYSVSGLLVRIDHATLGWIALGCLLVVALAIGLTIDRQRESTRDTAVAVVKWGSLVLTFAAAWFLSLAAQAYGEQANGACLTSHVFIDSSCNGAQALHRWIATFAVVNVFIWSASAIARWARRAYRRSTGESATHLPVWQELWPGLKNALGFLFATAAAGALAGWLLYLYADSFARGGLMQLVGTDALRSWLVDRVQVAAEVDDMIRHVQGTFHLSIGMLLVALILSISIALQIGLCGRTISESDREWLGRLGGVLYIGGIASIASSLVVAAGPGVWIWWKSSGVMSWLAGSAAALWALQTIVGILLGRSAATGGIAAKRPWVEKVLLVTPFLFAFGLLGAIAIATTNVMDTHLQTPPRNTLTAIERYCQQSVSLPPVVFSSPCSGINRALSLPLVAMAYPWYMLLAASLAALALVTLLAWRIDINLFSFQMFYRNRLTRCYLGATQRETKDRATRRENAFTSLSFLDDVPLSKLRSVDDEGVRVQRPLHLVNVAMNGVDDNLGQQERKARNFTFSPLFTGYAEPTDATGCYRRTRLYAMFEQRLMPNRRRWNRGASLGLAMATSGAAASPAMGYHSSPAIALLLTIFNVRLGAWLGNTRGGNHWAFESPAFGLRYLVNELLGAARSDSKYVYLSDGGHFENTAAYELVKRRLPLIVVCDCGADPEYQFSDLAHLTRLVKLDLGHTIEFDPASLKPDANGLSASHFTIAHIAYRDDPTHPNNDVREGKLVVIKPTLSKRCCTTLFEFRQRNGKFPQQTTADQWFDETQFESYRQLGFESARSAFEPYSKGRALIAKFL